MSLQGGKIAGGNPKNGRVENDYYATNPLALKMLLEKETFLMKDVLEPCVGGGHLAEYIKDNFESNVSGYDIVDRGYHPSNINIMIEDFLKSNVNKKYDTIITNPPFSLAMEFVKKSFDFLKDNGKIAMFLKIQFLESEKREEFFSEHPPKKIYVFRKRMATWNKGRKLNENGKRWATTMCHAWFIWEKDFNGKPTIDWI